VRVVLDTNVIVAAFGTRGLCEDVVRVCLSRHEIFLSEAIFREVQEQLPKKFKLPFARAAEIVSLLRERAEIVEPALIPAGACRDAKDLVILGTAVSAHADCLVTGDRDLLDLGAYEGIAIVTPREFHGLAS
jgi:putative PIN family toxin of toxin-antitoxin system